MAEAEVEVLDILDQATSSGTKEPPPRIEIFDYAVASTLDPAES